MPITSATFEKIYLRPLAEEGYFASILCISPENPSILIIDCATYTTDHDDETGFSSVLRVNYNDPHDVGGKCVACDTAVTDDTVYEWVRGSTLCPLCDTWTKPWTMQRRSYRGLFKILPGLPAQFVPSSSIVPAGMEEMTSAYQIRLISEALTTAHSEFLTFTERIRCNDSNYSDDQYFLDVITAKGRLSPFQWSANTPMEQIQDCLRNAEAAEESLRMKEQSTIVGMSLNMH
jgi:hypothetical protein